MPARKEQTVFTAKAISAAAVPLAAFIYTYRSKLADIARPGSRYQTPIGTPALDSFSRDLFFERGSGVRELIVPDVARGRVSKVLLRQTKPSTFAFHRQFFAEPDDVNVKKVGVNKHFLKQLRAILRIIIPRATSKEVFLFLLHTFFLVFRSYLSLLGARLDGRIVRDLVTANGRGFVTGLCLWYALAVPSTYTNSMIRFLQQKLAISFRTRLTRYTHDLYMGNNNFYKVLNLDSRIDGADQFITTDVAHFCETLAALYSNLSKPILDLILFNIQLAQSIGRWGTIGIFASYLSTGWVLRRATPAFGKLAAVEAKLEGDFRSAHSRVITNAEEIAFYDGERLEQDILTRSYLRLIKHINGILKIRILYGMTEDFLIKYLWSAAGYCLISLPVFFGVKDMTGGDTMGKVAKRTESYISNRRLLLSLADAGGRLFSTNKELAELAGYTSRVFSLLSVLHLLNNNQYQSCVRASGMPTDQPFYDLGAINGALIEQNSAGIDFEKIPIVAPAPGLSRGGEELVKALSFKIQDGDHILITGPNGCGKTSVARVLAGLWPVFEGIVRRPEKGNIVFLPQRPYLSLGSLRDQIIYPHSYPQFLSGGGTDEALLDVLKTVHLAYLPAREGSLDTRKNWKDVLSGGEKQRMGLARLFYHRPSYGVLDECTSAVSTDVEGSMYQAAKEAGITLMTISHRPSLLKYHVYQLKLTGDNGTWELSKVGTEEERLSLKNEIADLEEKLSEVEQWKARLGEIDSQMAFV